MYSNPNATMKLAPVVRSLTKLMDIKSLKLLDRYAAYNPSPLNIKQFINFGQTATEADSFQFLRREVPVRMANMMKELNLLPSHLLQMPSVIDLQEMYVQSFKELCEYEGTEMNRETMDHYVQTLMAVQDRHANVVKTMAQGVLELKESHAVDNQTEASIQYFLDRFYMNRISIRMLMNQHTSLFEPDAINDTRRIGVIDPRLNLKKVVQDSFNNASFLCEEYYDCAPDIELQVHNSVDEGQPIEIIYPPMHLYHILFELFKNSMRAVVENNGRSLELPDINVLISRGEHDVCIKISDQGGGIPRNVTDFLFHYLFSTAPRPEMKTAPKITPLAGYGYGLPLSRLYARYFHGELLLNSFDGYGTDALVYLQASPRNAVELLPVFNRTSTKQYKATVPTPDWTDPHSAMNKQYHPHFFSRPDPRIKSAKDE